MLRQDAPATAKTYAKTELRWNTRVRGQRTERGKENVVSFDGVEFTIGAYALGRLRKRCKSLCLNYFARVAELADARDSKSRARKGVPVQLRALVLKAPKDLRRFAVSPFSVTLHSGVTFV